jgi:hypothetical protein
MMLKKTLKSKAKLTADELLKTSKKKDVELTAKELGQVTGGTTAKTEQQHYTVKLTNANISSVDLR